jgi:1,4-alpha-glucan branching enzyme
MDFRYAGSIVLEAHLPYVKEFRTEDDLEQTGEEGRFFESVSETFLPLLGVLDRLENDHIPFRLALAISPVLCHMLNDEHLQKKYLFYTDKQIEFGKQEIERTTGGGDINKLAHDFYNRAVDRRIAFTERYGKNILKAIDFYRRKGKVEILASCATHAFLPFISHNSESLQAQMEIPIAGYRRSFGGCPQGFWLPGLGWTSALEPYFKAYNFSYTILDSHGLLFGKPLPEKGSFYPVKTPNGTFIFARDFYAVREIEQISADALYMDTDRDAGYELPPEIVSPFLSKDGERRRTGCKYWARSVRGGNTIYNQRTASDRVVEQARMFIENTITRLQEASRHMEEAPLSLYAHNADNFGRFWHEGPQFIEALFRLAVGYRDFQFICPSEYIYRQNLSSLQVVVPEFSSMGYNGYAETWLDASNDWIYRHLSRSMERMTELAERFPDDTGLKERALNQAAREILLAQSGDWPALLYRQDSTEFARSQAENALRNFTTIYEALGSNYISTEWLTGLERRHNIFPHINYRVFRRKK